MAHSEILWTQDTPELLIELEYEQYDDEGYVYTWFVNMTRGGESFTSRSPWDSFLDAERFFDENRMLNVNVEGR